MEPGHEARPRLSAVIRHIALSLLTANIIPSVLFYCCLVAGDMVLALIAALAWCYGALAWRISTKRRTSGLLWLTLFGLTAKTALALASGSVFIYLLQPALSEGVFAVVFLLSLLTARPLVARLAADFYPVDADLAARPRVQQLFWRLTLMWAVICAAKAAVSLWLLHAVSISTYVETKTVLTPTTAIAGAALTVALCVQVGRHEGLLPSRHLVSAAV
jgi:intracellular septation protein A